MIDDTEVEELHVETVKNPEVKTTETEDFCKALSKELNDGPIWRSSKNLAKKLNVDVKDMDDFLIKQRAVCCKRGGKDDTEILFYYALVKRVEKSETPPKEMRSLIKEEDRYALISLHNTLLLFQSTLEKYALRIAEINQESFTNLVAGKDRLEAGIFLLVGKLKADTTKFPKI